MHKKKGQITIFMIAGLVLFVLVLMAYILTLNTEKVELPPDKIAALDASPARAYLQSCMEDLGKAGLELVGRQGGYYILSDGFDYTQAQSAFYYNDGASVPRLSTIENELSDFMDDFAYSCLQDADIPDLEIRTGIPKTITTIADDKVTFTVDTGITLVKEGEASNQLQPFLVVISPSRLKLIHDTSRLIVEEIVKDPETLCMSCLVDLAEERDFRISTNLISEKTVLFAITDYKSDIEEPYTFRFVAKLN